MDFWVPCLPRLGSCVPEHQDDIVSGCRLRVPEHQDDIVSGCRLRVPERTNLI